MRSIPKETVSENSVKSTSPTNTNIENNNIVNNNIVNDNSGDDNDCLLIDENESVLIRVISHATLYILFVMTVTVFTMVVNVQIIKWNTTCV